MTARIERSSQILLLMIAVLACTDISCTSAPREVTSQVSLPQRFTASGDRPLPREWWDSFEDSDLTGFIERALEANFSLQIAWDRLAQAEAIVRREGADLYPSLDLSAGASRTATRQRTSNGSRETDYAGNISLGAAAGYELDLWGRIRSSRDAAVLDARAGAEELQVAAIGLTAQVALDWYQLVEQYGQLEILTDQLDVNLKVLELVTLRFRRGQVGAADVLRQRQLVESSRGEIESSESLAKILEHRLLILQGRPPADPVAAPPRRSRLVELPPLPETGLPVELVTRRPDIRQAYWRVLAADRDVAAAFAARFPRLTLSVRAETSAEEVGDLFEGWLATIAADLVGPVIDGGSRRSEVERACALLSERLHELGQVVLDALGEVEDALVRERRQGAVITSLAKQLELSNQVVERVRDSYTKGAVEYLNVLDALLSNQSLQRTLLQARRLKIEFRIDLCRALAGGISLSRPELATLAEDMADAFGGETINFDE